ncbi:hypothetical protein FPOA_00850 [Fusarium poae]|uniref:Uncharacterized protein n=1 Tax=Fusarium poae TaxID=36050 RepID=A0A1B8B2E6_FUSPO|nr:hypothetical protein FPOA_00850 [Fusarium poae]
MRAIEAYKYLIDFTPYKDVVNLVEELPGINGVVKGSGFDHLVNVFSKMNSVTNVGIHLSLVLLGVASRICLSFSSYVSFMALVLYLLVNNIGLEAFYDRLTDTLNRLGIDAASHFPIIRLYSMDGEVASGVKRDNQSTPAGRLDREADETELGDLTDQFLLEATLVSEKLAAGSIRDEISGPLYVP